AAAGPNDIVKITANETVPASKTIGALVLAGSTTIVATLNAGVTLTLSTGAVMTAQSGGHGVFGTTFAANVAQGALNFGADGVAFINGTGNNNFFNTALQGTGNLAVSISPAISNALILNTGGSTSAPSTVNFVLNSGLVNVVANGAVVGANFGTGTLTLVGGTLNSNSGGIGFNFSNPLVLAGLATIGNTQSTDTFSFTGPITLAANSVLRAGNNVFFNGVVG